MAVSRKRGTSKKESPIPYIALSIILFSVIGIIGMKAKVELSKTAQEVSNPMRTRGQPNAPIKIIEYADFQCPSCATGAHELKKYMKEHPDAIFFGV